MASYTTNSANLLEFAQARLATGIDQKNPGRVYVCIPADVNEIKLTTDQSGKSRADARIAIWPMRNREAYLQSVNTKRIAAGDQPRTLDEIPTHNMQINHSNDFVLANIKKFGKALIDKALSRQTEAYAAQIKDDNAEDTNSKLFKCIRSLMNPTLSNLYQHVSERTSAPVQAQIAQGVQGYTAPVEQDPLAYLAQQSSENEDELPF
ncbi:MAG: hypothetical protein MJZ30_07655 [Paludibacteraceae bacterium]|nr:hypothetical protein [Paludibacteraceae bacterium]